MLNGFLLAAGRGTRLGPLTQHVAKPALPVAGYPLLAYALNLFYKAKVKKLAINVHHAPRSITDLLARIEQPWQLYVSHEETLLDTGGGVKKCEHFLADAPTLLVNGDIVCDIDPQQLFHFHSVHAADLTLVAIPHPEAEKIAPLAIAPDHRIIDINRTFGKNHSRNCIYAGIAIFQPELFSFLKQEASSIVYTGFTGMIAAGKKVFAFLHHGQWFDCGTLPELHRAENSIKECADFWLQF
ncbi:MAG: sugar phosphate nucleotidyltransferase, partial [Leptospiraceae bacterium]|nr:sugar phosphate nucleotidyltransferase [Leptospiraceae bacterium]